MQETDRERVSAFQRLTDERLGSSYRLATAILRDDDVAKDAVHDAIVLAWQRWRSLRDRSKIDAWFDRIVVNVCRDRLKASKHRRTEDLDQATLPSSPDVAPDVHRRILVGQALARLKPDDIVVIAMRHFLDLQMDDIAVLLGVPVSTARTRLQVARSRLRTQLQSEEVDE